MAQKTITQRVDLMRQDGSDMLLWPKVLAVKGDAYAHLWRVELYSNGTPVSLAGQTAMCYAVNALGQSVPINASISGNVASASFPPACYAGAGNMDAMMSVAGPNQTPTLALMRLRVLDGLTDVVIDPDDIVPSLSALLALVGQLADAATAEAGRASAERLRSTAEGNRATAESARVRAEQARATAEAARASAEQLRASAEQTRQTQESTRQTKEGQRQSAEQLRASNEQTRQSNESTRQSAESGRSSAEQTRQTQESTRQTKEGQRQSAEQTRQSNEGTRSSAEQTRQSNETARQNNETARNTKLGNLSFDVTMIEPSGNPRAEVTQDEDSIEAHLFIPTSNLAYATFYIDLETKQLMMVSPEGFDAITFRLNRENKQLEVGI